MRTWLEGTFGGIRCALCIEKTNGARRGYRAIPYVVTPDAMTPFCDPDGLGFIALEHVTEQTALAGGRWFLEDEFGPATVGGELIAVEFVPRRLSAPRPLTAVRHRRE